MAKIIPDANGAPQNNLLQVKADLYAIAQQMIALYDTIPPAEKIKAKNNTASITAWQAASTADKDNANLILNAITVIGVWFLVDKALG